MVADYTAADSMRWALLDKIISSLDLTKTQRELAEQRYNAVTKVLADSNNPLLRNAEIYPQGSFRLGTSVKPLGRDEFDIDLVCHIPVYSSLVSSQDIYNAIGSILGENKTYAKILEPKKRCWRLNYAGEFHMDITPSTIDDDRRFIGGEMVPDRQLSLWKPTNPRGYAEWVEERDSIVSLYEGLLIAKDVRASIEPLPDADAPAGILKKFIQLMKRSRDIYFLNHYNADYAPISIILTTLASHAYEKCARHKRYDSVLQLFEDVIADMPNHINTPSILGETHYIVANPKHHEENFADKWLSNPRYKSAFDSWHHALSSTIAELHKIDGGIDRYTLALGTSFGEKVAKTAVDEMGKVFAGHKSYGTLGILAGTGVTAQCADAVPARKNTFFGS